MTSTDDVLELTCGAPGHGGFVIARADDGRAIFVRGGLPGERVRARITEVKKSYARAATVDVLEPSPHRVDDACPAARAGAGCCDLTFATPRFQRELKTDVLSELLVRFGGFREGALTPAVQPLTAALEGVPRGSGAGGDGARGDGVGVDGAAERGWRGRARVVADHAGALGHHAFRSDAVVVAPCAQLPAELNATAAELRAGPGVEVALVLDDEAAVHAALPARRGRPAEVLAGGPLARYRVGTRTWNIAVGGFWQAHRDAASTFSARCDAMLDRSGVRAGDGARAWDLYGGAGVFAAVLADRGFAVDVVETSMSAITAGKQTLANDPVRFHRGDVGPRLRSLRAPSAVILDPPRTGAGAAVMGAVCAAGPGAIVHIGCDAAAFARDLGAAARAGYRVAEVEAFDAFPGTHHLEALALLVPGHEDRHGR